VGVIRWSWAKTQFTDKIADAEGVHEGNAELRCRGCDWLGDFAGWSIFANDQRRQQEKPRSPAALFHR
jgi:hypothetical protein